jgi:hypothetical protein
LVIVNNKLAFILVPKNASTSLRSFYGIPSHHYVKKIKGTYVSQDIQFIKFNKAMLLTTDEYLEKPMIEHVSLKKAISTNIIDKDARIIAIIREPLERQLSLYLYRHRQKKYNEELSVLDFREKMRSGVLLDDFSWQTQLQSWFTQHESVAVEYWPYTNLNNNFKEFGVLDYCNVSFTSSKYKTSQLIDIFYDSVTRKAAESYWEKDIDLYKIICSTNRKY